MSESETGARLATGGVNTSVPSQAGPAPDALFGTPDTWSIEQNLAPGEREKIQQFFTDRYRYAVIRGRARGHFYQLMADGIMLDHRPDYAKRFYDGLPAFRNRLKETGTEDSDPVELIVESLAHLPMYVLLGWETGLYNEFRHLRSRGLTKDQILELVLFGQLQAGIRGLQLAYNGMSKLLASVPVFPEPAPWPKNWAPDNAAFRAGLDLSVRPLTSEDRRNVTDWYEKTIGYVPTAAAFAMTHHPEFYKWHRARWEIIFQKLPKQTAPYVMLRQHMLTGYTGALREAALLGKAWNIGKEWLVHGLMVTAWYTGFEGLYPAHDAMADILDDSSWE
jgi:hypothetical protein